MDRHVRWFRRQIAIGVARRLAAETVVFGALALGGSLIAGANAITAATATVLAIMITPPLRIAIGLAANPMNSAYLNSWPHPSGETLPTPQTNAGSADDETLRGYGFTCRGAFDEWGGAVTNVYTRDSSQIIVITSEDGDLVALSALDRDSLAITTKQLIPPHERLVVNQLHNADIREILASHIDLMNRQASLGRSVKAIDFREVLELLAIEWDSWDQIGPLLGPFVALGSRRSPSLLQVRVAADEVLDRTSAPRPKITARPTRMQPPTHVQPADPAPTPTPPPIPTTAVTPPPVHIFHVPTNAEAA